MHQLAIALKHKGYRITGSDDEIFEPALANLKREEICPDKMGWFPENITTKIDAIILGMHAKADNPEVEKAIELGLKIFSFPEYIFHESLHKKRVAVGGSHGKTTTTAMIRPAIIPVSTPASGDVGVTCPFCPCLATKSHHLASETVVK